MVGWVLHFVLGLLFGLVLFVRQLSGLLGQLLGLLGQLLGPSGIALGVGVIQFGLLWHRIGFPFRCGTFLFILAAHLEGGCFPSGFNGCFFHFSAVLDGLVLVFVLILMLSV